MINNGKYHKNHCIAMLLAGGQGSRLGVLTKNLAKPAVPFGGKYRIIDFTLSNCSNSNIETVGVLTQYNPMILNSTLGIGSPWDLDRKKGGVSVLPPYVRQDGGHWYTGTANAVYQNLDFIDLHDPDHVIVLSGDHIYKMDYSKMLDYHKEQEADATIAVLEVPWEEANRFGIMYVRESGRIYEFEEKPEKPKNNMASMGIYIFNKEVLKKYLEQDALNPNSNNDFGKDIIPAMLQDSANLYAYTFDDYWKDVGTIQSLWEANMDLLDEHSQLNLHDEDWRIYSLNPDLPPHYIAEGAKVERSLINEGAYIEGEVINSIVFPGVVIEKGSSVKDSIIMTYAKIGQNSYVDEAIIDEYTEIGDNCSIGYEKYENEKSGTSPQITVIGEDLNIGSDYLIEKGEIIDSDLS